MIKVLFVYDYNDNISTVKSGVTSALQNLQEGFSHHENKVTIVILSQANETKYEKLYSNVIYKSCRPRIKFLSSIKILDILINRNIILKKEIRKYQPDILHVNTTGPYLLSLHGLDKNKIIVTQHGVLCEELKLQNTYLSKLKFLFKAVVETIYFPLFKNIIFISLYNKQKFAGKRYLVNKRTSIIPNGISFNSHRYNKNTKLNNKLIYVGAVNKRKNLLLLLKAVASLKEKGINLHLTVVGGSKEQEYLNRILIFLNRNKLKNDVTLLGWVENSEVKNLLFENDFLVLPSNQETLPVSILEAFSVGTPVIASSVGGIPEMIDDRVNGFIFTPNKLEQLIDILEEIYVNRKTKTYEELSRNAFETAIFKYSAKTIASRHIEFYNIIKNINLELKSNENTNFEKKI